MLLEQAEQALHRAGLRAIRLSANERAVEYFSVALAGRRRRRAPPHGGGAATAAGSRSWRCAGWAHPK